LPEIVMVSISGNVRTKSEIVLRELLFATGDPLDTNLVAESARKLRALPYLGDARIHVRRKGDSAEVEVEVEDLYSRALSPQFAGDVDEFSYGLIGLDYNFLGRGQTAEATIHHDAVTGNRATAYYHIPRLRGSHLSASASAGAGDEGHDLGIAVAKPFFALSSRWAYGASITSNESVQRLYDGGRLAARYTDRLDQASLWLRHSHGDDLKVRPSLRLSVSERRFAPEAADLPYAPEDRQRLLPSIGLVVWRPGYTRANYVHALGRTEDLQTGSWLSTSVSQSARVLGSDRNFTSYALQLVPRQAFAERTFTFASLFASTRRERGRYTNRFASAQLRVYRRVGALHSIAVRLRFDAIARTEDNAQLLLGALNGLRGYAARRFDGRRRLLFNAEARPTVYRHPYFVVAGALFVDAGRAWTPGESGKVEMGFGAGGRIGLPRVYNTPVMRADLAYGAGDGTWQLSFGIGQYF
jgi:outer membrane protein assembly factor BamA